MKNLFFFYIFLVIFNYSNSQSAFFNYDLDSKKHLIDKLENKLEFQINNIDSKHKSDIKKVYKARHQKYIEWLNDSTFVRNKNIERYIEEILGNIYANNPEINSNNFNFLLNKSVTPNASCFGDKNFSINIGLLSFFNNEDEIAFIICHEIAHYQLNHVNKAIHGYFETANSSETKKTIRKIKKTKYNRNNESITFLKNLTFNLLKRTRKSEEEADSLGYELLKKTKYNSNAASTALLKLDSIKNQLFQTKIDLEKFFNHPEYPFKKSWLKKEETLFDLDSSANDLQWNKDSLKTHPDAKIRAQILSKKSTKSNHFFTKNHSKVVSRLKLDIIELNLKNNKFDIALYLLLNGIEHDVKNQEFYITKVAQLFHKLYYIRKKHQLGKFVRPVNHLSKEKKLIEIRQFLHNLELKNIRKIGYYFCLQNQNRTQNDNNEFKIAFNKLKQLNNK